MRVSFLYQKCCLSTTIANDFGQPRISSKILHSISGFLLIIEAVRTPKHRTCSGRNMCTFAK